MFRLLSFQTVKHPILNDVKIDFCVNDDFLNENEQIYSSVVIGQNGTGKSELLRYIASVFRELYNYKQDRLNGLVINHNIRLVYQINDDIYEVVSAKIQPVPTKLKQQNEAILYYKNPNGLDVITSKAGKFSIDTDSIKHRIKIDDLVLPERVIVSSIMLTDKFNSKSTESYKYLGVRNEGSAQSAGTKSYIRRTVNFIIESIREPFFIAELKNLLNFLELQESFFISYIPRYRNKFMNGNLTVEKFHFSFMNWTEVFDKRKNQPWGLEHYNKIKSDDFLIERIVEFLNKLSSNLKSYGSGGRYFVYDILNDTNIIEDFILIQQLNSLNLIAYPSISIKKINTTNEYNLENSSSGESHFVASMIGLLASIKHDSLVLIDEPEISLHPNWQMKYIMHLKRSFKSFSSCHFILATHSHFMISDLEPKSSNVIALTRNFENKIEANVIDSDTYGWSVDEILYKVFKVRNTRNYFFEKELRELVYLMNNNPRNKSEIIKLLEHIEPFKISKDDPLNRIINTAKNLI